MKKILLLTILFISMIKTVMACPMCTSPTAMQIRNYLFGPDLVLNVIALLLPFVIFTALVASVYYFGLPFTTKKL